MLLSIDEVVNMTPDHTIVFVGQSANVFDLPANAQSKGNLVAFHEFYMGMGPWLVAPNITGDTEPASVTVAKALFGRFTSQSIAYWPVDTGSAPNIVPAYKQGLVTTAYANELALQQPTPATCVFVIAPTGDITAQLIQLVTYQAVGASGDIMVGQNTWLSGINQSPPNWGPNQQLPEFNYALNTVTWKIKSGDFDYRAVQRLMNGPAQGNGYYAAGEFPPGWGQGVSQTTLLSTPSTPFDVEWVDNRAVFCSPSSPFLHLSLLAGSALTFKRPWLQDYAANLITYTATAASAWDDIMACSLLILKVITDASGELPWPIDGIADYCFDEAMEHVDPGFVPPVPPWLQ